MFSIPAGSLFAADPASNITSGVATVADDFEGNKLLISADSFSSRRSDQNAVFSGNVKTTYGATTITSNLLRIFYNENNF